MQARNHNRSRNNHYPLILAAIVLGLLAWPGTARAADRVSQNGITWHFDRDYQVGQFVLGDWWVVGPVTINSVDPAWDGQRHGSMVDPDASQDTQGYRAGLDVTYVDSLRVRFPVTLSGVTSLISTEGLPSIVPGGSHEGIKSAAVLTVVAGPPAADAFRPAYAQGQKLFFRVSQMQTSLLLGLAAPASVADAVSGYQDAFTKVYLDHASSGGNLGASLHPVDNGLPYGRDFSVGVSNATLIALSNHGQALEYAKRLVQMGIDFYSMWLVNDKRVEGSGFGWGFKWPILLAGILLGDSGMKNPPLYRSGTINKFPEDRWTSYGSPTPAWPQGKPLWGTVDPQYNECPPDLNANADCTGQPAGYRICCSSFTWVGQALAARLLGATGLWNHPAYFDYVDRWVSEPSSWWYGDSDPYYGAVYGFGGQFVRDMWSAYRGTTAQTCAQLGGTPCSSGDICQGGTFHISSDHAGSCCVGGTCQPAPPADAGPVADRGPDRSLPGRETGPVADGGPDRSLPGRDAGVDAPAASDRSLPRADGGADAAARDRSSADLGRTDRASFADGATPRTTLLGGCQCGLTGRGSGGGGAAALLLAALGLLRRRRGH
jgi:hypothetical protein